jgi:hypothetical protein
MTHNPTDCQRIEAWYESQSEETLRDLQDRFDAQTPRQAWEAFFKDCPPPAPQSPGESLAAPASAVQEVCPFNQQARDLVDLSAARPWDGSARDLRPVFPSGHKSFDGVVGQGRIAILSMCIRHIRETGDGELSMFLGDCLQHLPECEAYVAHLIELDAALLAEVRESGGRWGLCDVLKSRDVPNVSGWSAAVCHLNLSGGQA